MTDALRFCVREDGEVAEVRRGALRLAAALGLPEVDRGRLAIVTTEAGTNLVKHGGGGQIVISATEWGDDAAAVQVLALDQGSGMADVRASLRDGHSTAGSPGTGLGAMRRQTAALDIYSLPAAGTAILAVVGPAAPRPSLRRHAVAVGGVAVPKPGETTCGDAWASEPTSAGARVLVADGLGHGPEARRAARTATELFRQSRDLAPEETMHRLHEALRPTRGAAIGLAELDGESGTVRFVGVGNVSGVVWSPDGARHLVSHNGIPGHEMRRVQAFTYPWPDGALVVLHTDGLGGHWSLDRYPGLASRHPALVAGVLYRDHARGRDDATVVVARREAA